MGEALISRAGGGTGNGGSSEPDIPALPGYHTTLITLKDYQNKAMPNYTINCKDGASWYNYTTNEKGQALFTSNSGSCNFTVFNNIGARYLDFNTSYMNIDAPLGQTSRHNLIVNKTIGTIYLTASANYRFIIPRNNVNVTLCGGGGGGGGGVHYSDEYTTKDLTGGRGGSGYTTSPKFNFQSNVNYYASIGSGGSGGHSDEYWIYSHAANGSSGGTTTFINTSATGGGGGEGADDIWSTPSAGAGGAGLSPYGIGGSGGTGDYNGTSGKAGCVRLIFS